MKLLFLASILCFFHSVSFSQVEFLNEINDLGIITEVSNPFVDIPIKNTSNKKVYIFRTDADPKLYDINYSSKTIMPDSVVYMRVKYKPQKKGFFRQNLPMHFSCYETPVQITVEGMVNSIPRENDMPCPSFNEQCANCSPDFELKITVIDALNNTPLSKSTVKIIKNGRLKDEVITKKSGSYETSGEIGYFLFLANHPGYNSNELATYVNKRQNEFIIPLDKILETLPEETDEEITVFIDPETDVADTDSLITSEDVPVSDLPQVEPHPEFSKKDFRPNNIVFLVDVSSSMRFAGKLDILKASMINLTEILRDVDKITIVSYASKAEVVLETTNAEDVDSLIDIIANLEAKGFTAGGEGMKLAYNRACNAKIIEGNNQIIMATDGAFNRGEENVFKLAKKYRKNGVTVSVVGIKNSDTNKLIMEKLAEDGGGSYLDLQTYEAAENALVEEIKSNSRIGK